MPIPDGSHTDWPWPFSLIDRKTNAWGSNKAPKVLAGEAGENHNADIPAPGSWVITWPLYIAGTTEGGWHWRFGVRYDFVDKYYTFPSFTVKKIEF